MTDRLTPSTTDHVQHFAVTTFSLLQQLCTVSHRIFIWPIWTCFCHWINTHARTQPFNGLWSGTTRVGRYQKKHSPTHTHPDHRTSFINFLYLLRSIASSLYILHAWQSFSTTSLQVLFGLPLGLHAFLYPIIIFFSQHMPIPSQSVLL